MPPEAWPESQPAAVVWDLDGTLVDTAADLCFALNRVLKIEGLEPLKPEAVRGMIGHGVAWLLKSGFESAGRDLGTGKIERLSPVFIEHYRQVATRKTRLFPGVRAVLDGLYGIGVPQGVCTNKPLSLSRQILAGLGLESYFACVVGGDSTPERKPHPQPLLTCLEALGVDPEPSLMIGDSATDVATARAAGVPVTVVGWGYTLEPPQSLAADYFLGDLGDPSSLPPWLGEEMGSG